jgi:ribulose-5-phosphate 4-epimerase/fuculose-1-phosphate aldolase
MFDFAPYEGSPKDAGEAIEQCVLANRILANERVLDAFGHVSVRNPENAGSFFQSRALAPEFVCIGDVLEIGLDGDVLGPSGAKAYGERIIHASIYKARPDVNAVFHGHPHEVIALSSVGAPFRPLAQFCGMFYEGLPYFDEYSNNSGMLVVSREDGDLLARRLGAAIGIIMRGHGCTLTGGSVQQMTMNAIFLRDNARMQLMALPLGEPACLSAEEGRDAARRQYSAISLGRCWDYWVARAKKAMPDLP